MARPKTIQDGVATNLLLARKTRLNAARLAGDRYGISLNELVNRLLAREVEHPTGLCKYRPRLLATAK